MRINVYQIDGEDNARIKFENYKRTLELGGVDPSKYKCVFHGYVNAKTADDVYNIFNGFRDSNIGTYQGHSLSISDVVEIVDDIPEIYGKIDFLYAGEDHIGKVCVEILIPEEYDAGIFLTGHLPCQADQQILQLQKDCLLTAEKGSGIHSQKAVFSHVKGCRRFFDDRLHGAAQGVA